MRENIQRVAERGERLDALQDKTLVVHFLIPLSCTSKKLTADRSAGDQRQPGGLGSGLQEGCEQGQEGYVSGQTDYQRGFRNIR